MNIFYEINIYDKLIIDKTVKYVNMSRFNAVQLICIIRSKLYQNKFFHFLQNILKTLLTNNCNDLYFC